VRYALCVRRARALGYDSAYQRVNMSAIQKETEKSRLCSQHAKCQQRHVRYAHANDASCCRAFAARTRVRAPRYARRRRCAMKNQYNQSTYNRARLSSGYNVTIRANARGECRVTRKSRRRAVFKRNASTNACRSTYEARVQRARQSGSGVLRGEQDAAARQQR